MPKVVDHAERRRAIVDACLRLVARDGLAHTTTREIAREAGVSHGIIAHYFESKQDILRAALQQSYENVAERIARRVAGLDGAAALREALLESLPEDDESRAGEQIELAFWSYSLGEETLATERWQSYAIWRDHLERFANQARVRGEMPAVHEPGVVVDALIALVDGLGAQAVLYPDRLTINRLRTALDSVLQAYGITVSKRRD